MQQGYKDLFQLFKRGQLSKTIIWLTVTLTLLDAASAVAFPYLTQLLVDDLSINGSLPWSILSVLITILIIGAIAQACSTFLVGKLGQSFVAKTRVRLHKKLINLPVRRFDEAYAAEPAGRLINDTQVISSLLSEQLIGFVSGVATLLASLVILWLIDPVLTGVLFGCVIGAFIFVLPLAGSLGALSTKLQDLKAAFIGRLSEVFTNIRLVKSSVAEKQEEKLAAEQIDQLYNKGMKEVLVMSLFGPIVGLAIVAAMICILVVGASRVADGSITMGALIAFILYLFNIVMPMAMLSAFIAALNKAAGAAKRLAEIDEDDVEPTKGETVDLNGHSIKINGLSFQYNEDNQYTLAIESLNIPANSVTALVGSSGSGKSTLFSLLNRYYPSTGIRVDDRDINELELSSWRQQISTVAQTAPVLSGSVRFNLEYGVPDEYSDEQLIEALQKAQLWDYLEKQNGLDTEIDEQGTNLSGGQKQRLSIARAILRQPKILILDEATSALDAHTEKAVNDALEPLMHGRTTLVAAHRLSTVQHADQIVVLEKGEIIAVGKHQQLMETSEHYQQLVKQQIQQEA